MRITRNNYEQYFLDHLEGNLSPELEKELSEFLDANPDLKQILDDYHPTPVTPEKIHNESLKKRLKKNISPTDHIDENHVEEWLIRSLEGLLTEDEKIELDEFLALNPAYTYDQKLFALTRQVPDESVVFTGKEKLKRRGALLPFRQFYWMLPATAAIVLLFLGIRYFQQPDVGNGTPSQFAGTPSQMSEAQPVDTKNFPGTPSQISETLSQFGKALAQQSTTHSETPSQIKETPSHIYSFLKEMTAITDVVIANTPVVSPDIELIAFTTTPVQTVEVKEKKLIAKVFSNMLAKVKDGIGSDNDRDGDGLPDFSIWTIAQAGVKGYNTISDRDLELFVNKDDDGKVTSYALINDDRLLLERELNRQ